MGNANSGIVGIVKGPYPQPVVSRKYMYHKKELIPIIAIIIGDLIFATAVSIWMYNTRDIVIDRRKKPINEQMDLLKPYHLKWIVINQILEPGVDLHAAYEAMKEEEKRKEEEKNGK